MKKPLTYIKALAILSEINETMLNSKKILIDQYFKNSDSLLDLIFRSSFFDEERVGLIETVEKLSQQPNLSPITFQNSFMSLQTSLN